ncbi:MAG: TIGR02679 family protein [Streptosporangiaceae bacterium]
MGPLSGLPPELAPLWRAMHSRLSSGRPVSRVRIGPLTEPQQSALADLLGLPRLPGEYPVVSLAALDEVLIESVGAPAREVVAALIGPLGDRAGDLEAAAAGRSRLWAWLAEHPVVSAQPALAAWVAGVRRSGLAGGSAQRTRDELERALRVLAELPAAGVPLPVLADQVLGDTHALDVGTRCAGQVLRALAAIYDVPPPANAQERRALWDRAGVADDALSAVVLAAGIRAGGTSVAAQISRVCAEAGQAAVLTLGHLRASDWTIGPAQVWVFENPSVLAVALARFGASCPPIVVTSGWPNSAAILLLRKLATAGARLHYHGDFDGEGLRIAAAVVARTGAAPWRMTSTDYLDAVADGPPVGRMSEVPWDEHLAAHMTEIGITLPEERVAAALLDEIANRITAPANGPPPGPPAPTAPPPR